MAGTFLRRQATADRGAGVATIRATDFDKTTNDMRLFNFTVEVDSGGGSVGVELLGDLDWFVERVGLASNEQLIIKRPINGIRLTWTGGSGGSAIVMASPKYEGGIP